MQLIARINKIVDRFLVKEANPQLVALFRIFFGLAGIFFCYHTIDQWVILFGDVEYSSYLKILAYTWLVSIFLIMIGIAHFPIRVLHFIAAGAILTLSHGVFNVECKFYVMGAYWMMFLDLRRSSLFYNISPRPKAFPIFFFFLSTAAYVFYGGFVTKMFDPSWNGTGLGFYYFMQLPWVKFRAVHSILDYKWLMLIFNYTALFIEGLIFVCFCFKKTRKIAIVFFYAFAFLLLFALISNIGTIALSFCILFAHFLVKPEKNILPFLNNISVNKPKSLPSRYQLSIHRATFIVCFMTCTNAIFFGTTETIGYLESTDIKARTRPIQPFVKQYNAIMRTFNSNGLIKGAHFFNSHVTLVRHDYLFTEVHLLNLWEYRIIINYADGTNGEPVDIFNPDFTAGSYSNQYYLSSRWLQANMYRLPDLKNDVESGVPLPKWATNTVKYALEKNKKDNIQSVDFVIAPIKMPDGFEGDVWLNGAEDWITAFTLTKDQLNQL